MAAAVFAPAKGCYLSLPIALMLLHPVLGALSLTLVVAAFLTTSGVIKIWTGSTAGAW